MTNADNLRQRIDNAIRDTEAFEYAISQHEIKGLVELLKQARDAKSDTNQDISNKIAKPDAQLVKDINDLMMDMNVSDVYGSGATEYEGKAYRLLDRCLLALSGQGENND